MIRVVAAALIREGEVLVARRGPHQRNALQWELPGGKVEAGETDAQALTRELSEELDVEIAVERWLAEAVHHYDWGSICLVALRCRLVQGQPHEILIIQTDIYPYFIEQKGSAPGYKPYDAARLTAPQAGRSTGSR